MSNMQTAGQSVSAQPAVAWTRDDIAFVIGLQDEVNILAEQLCIELRLRVHRAMKKCDPSQPVDSLDDEAVIVPPLGATDRVHVVGFKVPHNLVTGADARVDYNSTGNDGYAFGYPLSCYLHATPTSAPPGWPVHRLTQAFDRLPLAHFAPSGGAITACINGQNVLLILPAQYAAVFPLLDRNFPYA